MGCSVQMIATLGVVAVLVMLVLAWVMAGRAAISGKGSDAEDNKRGGECESCECAGGACQRPSAD
jgi:hypothetical protein